MPDGWSVLNEIYSSGGEAGEVFTEKGRILVHVGEYAYAAAPEGAAVRALYDSGALDGAFERWARARGLVQLGPDWSTDTSDVVSTDGTQIRRVTVGEDR